MSIRKFTSSVGVVLLLFGSSAFGREKDQPGTAAKVPDLTQSCAKECPGATNNNDVFKCVENLEKGLGEAALKKKHRACYQAHEKYEKLTGKEQAGEEAHEQR